MKPKKFKKSLSLNKRTISNLRNIEQNKVKGGKPPESEWPGEPCEVLVTIDPCNLLTLCGDDTICTA